MTRRRKHKARQGRWFVVLSAVDDYQLTAIGVFTSDNPHTFFQKTTIQSLKGKLFGLRDKHLPGKRIGAINLRVNGNQDVLALTVDSMIDVFRANVIFKRKQMYQFCLTFSDPMSQ